MDTNILEWDLIHFTKPVQTFPTRDDGYKHLGVNQYIRSHAARVYKRLPHVSFLFCKLHNCAPPCLWRAALVELRNGCEMRQPEDDKYSCHNPECTMLVGKRGLDTLVQRQTFEKLFNDFAVPLRPRTALRSFNIDQKKCPPDVERLVKLGKVQRLKKTVTQALTHSRVDLGDIVQATTQHWQTPRANHKTPHASMG